MEVKAAEIDTGLVQQQRCSLGSMELNADRLLLQQTLLLEQDKEYRRTLKLKSIVLY